MSMLAPAGFATFPCPSCGTAFPATMPAGLRIPCPTCRTTFTVPDHGGWSADQAQAYQAWAMVQGNTAAALSDQTAPSAANRLFASTSNPVLCLDGAGRHLAIGAQVSREHGWWLRAVDVATGAVRWDALAGSHFRTSPGREAICARSGRIYLAHEGQLVAIDAERGDVRWRTPLGERLASDIDRVPAQGDELELYELGAPGERVVLVARTRDERLVALDRDAGHALWSRTGAGRSDPAAGAVLVRSDQGIELVRPRDGVRQAFFPRGGFDDAWPVAGLVVMKADDYGDAEQSGVLFVDPSDGHAISFHPAEDADLSTPPVELGGKVLVRVSSNSGDSLLAIEPGRAAAKPGLFARLFGGGKAAMRALPWKQHSVDALHVVGDALFVEAGSFEGVRRVAVLDGATLAVRHDSGPLPDGHTPGIRPGVVCAYSACREHGTPHELRAVAPATGQIAWTRQLPDLQEVAYAGDVIALWSDGRAELVDPVSGRTRGGLPA
jgi:outer membrane protein assembly factor BamB